MHRIDGAGHVDHLFVAEDPATLRPPTEITPEIMNAFQEELATFIEWAGIALAKGDNTQLRQALVAKFAGLDVAATKAGVQGQTYTAFTTAGATGAFTLATVPAIAAYAAGQRFRVKFHAAGNGTDKLNVCALGDKNLKQYDSTGAKIAPVIAANQLVDVEYDGVDFVLLDQLPPAVAVKGFQVFTASGTFNIPAGVTEVVVEVWGGGGGGGGPNTSSVGANGGGGAGGYAMKRVTGLTPGGTVAVTIGAGGGVQNTVNAAGNNGSSSSFGAFCSATGGTGGFAGSWPNQDAPGGVGSGGDINLAGGLGTSDWQSSKGGIGGSAPRGGQGGLGGWGAALGGAGGLPGGGGGGGDNAGSQGGAGGGGMVFVRWGF